MELLRTENLRKAYSRRPVVNDVSFTVNTGEIVGLLGPNGAGKTTAFRMTIGMIRSDGGKVFFEGKDVTDLPMYLRARRGMGYLSQEPSVFQRLSVRDNILAVLETQKLSRKERLRRLDQLIERLSLGKVINSPAYALSGGERRRLEITRALAINPRLILLDEPFSGVDPIAVGHIQSIILGLINTGIGILLTDHNVHDTLSVTSRAYILNEGKIEAYGTAEELLNDPRARKFYLGDRFRIEHLAPPKTAEMELPEAFRRKTDETPSATEPQADGESPSSDDGSDASQGASDAR